MMALLQRRIGWVIGLCGLLTLTMLRAVIDPAGAVATYFGEPLTGPAADLVVRNWGALIGLIGALLVYTAVTGRHRRLIVLIAAISKTVFIALGLIYASAHLTGQLGLALLVDAVFVAIFAAYLMAGPAD